MGKKVGTRTIPTCLLKIKFFKEYKLKRRRGQVLCLTEFLKSRISLDFFKFMVYNMICLLGNNYTKNNNAQKFAKQISYANKYADLKMFFPIRHLFSKQKGIVWKIRIS